MQSESLVKRKIRLWWKWLWFGIKLFAVFYYVLTTTILLSLKKNLSGYRKLNAEILYNNVHATSSCSDKIHGKAMNRWKKEKERERNKMTERDVFETREKIQHTTTQTCISSVKLNFLHFLKASTFLRV